MTGSLKQFIISESLSSEHAERFLLFKERYHPQVLLDLKHELEKAWNKKVSKLTSRFKVSEETKSLEVLKNPKVFTDIALDRQEAKIMSRSREPVEVSPSVKISLLFTRDQRDIMIKELIDESQDVFKIVTDRWSEIFNIERKGRSVPVFKIVNDHDEVRLQLSLSSEKAEVYKTLYSVRIEFGKKGSKLRDFDRVYVQSLIT